MSAPLGGHALGWDCHVHVFDSAIPPKDGHYQPDHRPLAEIEHSASANGVGHLVLVQPSVYGTDNALILAALREKPGRHRAVVVLADDVEDSELDAMHAAGVRGARLNLVSPVGEGETVEQRFDALAPRLKARGWHLQWYVQPCQLAMVSVLHAGSGLTCVLDHMGGMNAGTGADDAAWTYLQALAQLGAWVKLSGWYRLGAQAPYAPLQNNTCRIAKIFGPRMVWGSDWPHTAFLTNAMPTYASTWQPVVDALGASAAKALRDQLPAIYL